MTDQQAAAYVLSMAVCAQVEIAGMQAENAQTPDSQPFTRADFMAVIEKYGIHHNAVLTTFQNAYRT
jgi:hypothetical protein